MLGVSLAAADQARLATTPLAALGRLALSVYVGHLVVCDHVPDLFPADTVAQGITHVAWFTLASAAFATLWLWPFRRGPLEALVRWPWQPVERLLAPPERP